MTPLFAEYSDLSQLDEIHPPVIPDTFEATVFLDGQAITLAVDQVQWDLLRKWFNYSVVSPNNSLHELVGMTCGLGEPQPIRLFLSSSKVSAIAQHL